MRPGNGQKNARWRQVETVYQAAIELTEPSRAEFLQAECGTDPELRSEVERLLTLSDAEDDFLEPPDSALAPGAEQVAAGPAAFRRNIRSYELLEPIATGGMGSVWRGRRSDGAFDQTVAIKFMDAGLLRADGHRRFDRERRTLAQLEHPCITRLIDGGSAEDGTPYLVMEYVDGVGIDEYCRRERLDLRARIELFLRVCEAVEFAHRNLIVHRDLKPSNILVDDTGSPKLLDFGIAKLIDDAADNVGDDCTVTMVRAMTPRYASPEQFRGQAVTTASDVYSLGVLLYELLTAERPYRLDTRTAFERQRIVCEHVPPLPSETVNVHAARAAHPATHFGGISPGQLQRTLRGDLDTIVMTAMHKEPARRYPAVRELTDDLRAYLDDRPIRARRDTLSYRVRKLVRRNKPATVLAAIAIAALVVTFASTVFQSRAARRQRDVAEAARAESEIVSSFLRESLTALAAGETAGNTGVLSMLRSASRRVDDELSRSPGARGQVHFTLGEAFMSFWAVADASTEFEKALEIYSDHYGPDSLETADVLANLGFIRVFEGDPVSVERLEAALAIRRQKLGERDAVVARTKTQLSQAYLRASFPPKVFEAEILLADALQTIESLFEWPHELYAYHGLQRARLLAQQRRFTEAYDVANRARETYRVLGLERDPAHVYLLDHIYFLENEMGLFDAARSTAAEHASFRKSVFGVMNATDAIWKLGWAECRVGRYAAALERYREVLLLDGDAAMRAARPSSAWVYDGLARALRGDPRVGGSGNEALAIVELMRALETRMPPETHSRRAYDIANLFLTTDRQADAIVVAEYSAAYRSRALPGDEAPHSHRLIGRAYMALGDYENAKRHLVKSMRAFRTPRKYPFAEITRSRALLADLYDTWGKPRKAAHYRRQVDRGNGVFR